MRRWTAMVGVFALVAAACAGSAADTTLATTTTAAVTTTAPTDLTIAASDGSGTLEVPAGAVPAGVTSDSITIAPDPAPVVGPAVDALVAFGFEAGPGFVLGPSGTTFTEPVVLRLPPPADGRTVAAFLVVDGGLQPLEPVDGGGVAFLVPHFSSVVTMFGPWFASLEAPDAAVVDEPFAVWSQVFSMTLSEGFTVGGVLLTEGPVDPRSQPAPPTSATALPMFTSTYTVTCTDPGAATIEHAVQASVERSRLTPQAQELFPSVHTHLRLTGMPAVTVECVPAGTATAGSNAAGVYSGSVAFTGIPGLPGGTYSDTFTLELRACGEASLTQRSAQTSHGHFYTVFDFEPEPAEPGFFLAHLFGSGSDYGEAYTLEVQVDGDTAQVGGVTAGGGHGFGTHLTEQEAWTAALFAELIAGLPDAFDEPPVDLGWAGQVEGTLERSGDAAPCS